MDKTLSNLRKECAKHGIKVKKQTFSWGPHVSFYIDGVETGNVFTQSFYDEHRKQFEALLRIKEQFAGLTYKGEKVYGITLKKTFPH